MESIAKKPAGGKRPGGRTADVTSRIREAVLQLLVEEGVTGCTFNAVARRAGVERSTLYRRYPDRWEMMIDMFMAHAAIDVMPDLGHSFAQNLRSVLGRLVATLMTPLGPAVIAVAAELRASKSNVHPRQYFDRRMAQLGPMFEAAIERGELPADVDREALFTFAAGPIYFRIFIAGREVDDTFIDAIIDSVCQAFGTSSCSPAVPLAPTMA